MPMSPEPGGGAPVAIAGRTMGVLVALMVVMDRDGRATIRTVAREACWSVGTTWRHLDVLIRAGLVTQADGRQGTLRPTVRIVGVWP